MKKTLIVKIISLIILAAAALIFAIAGIFGITLSDASVRTLGAVTLAALPVFAYTTVRLGKTE